MADVGDFLFGQGHGCTEASCLFQGFVDGLDAKVVEYSLLRHVLRRLVQSAHCFVGRVGFFVADEPVVHVSASFHLGKFPAEQLFIESRDLGRLFCRDFEVDDGVVFRRGSGNRCGRFHSGSSIPKRGYASLKHPAARTEGTLRSQHSASLTRFQARQFSKAAGADGTFIFENNPARTKSAAL